MRSHKIAPDATTPRDNTRTPATVWNEQLERLGGHLLQTWEWGDFKQRHGWSADRVRVEGPDGEGMAQILFRAKGPVSIGYVPRGPAIAGDIDAVWPELRAAIDRASRAHRAMATIIEFDRPLELAASYRTAGVVAGPGHIQPGRTVKIPLGDDASILAQMHQKTRYNVRLADKRGVRILAEPATEAAIDRFYALMTDTADRNEFGIHSRAYYDDFLRIFGDRAYLVFAETEGHDAATLIAARFGTEAIYMYGASSTKFRAHGAAFRMQFEAMRWARDNGASCYDLWGIPDEDPEPSSSDDKPGAAASTHGSDWRGLYRFKTGFGGTIVRYPPTVERRYLPVAPWLARKLNLIKG